MSYPLVISLSMGVIGMLMGMFLYSALTSDIDCESLSNEELQGDCENALNTAWIVIGLLPIALFMVMYQLMAGTGASMRVINISNIEERTKKMQELGVNHVLKKCKATLYDESKRGNKLYLLKVIPNYPLKYLVYEDPSTAGKIYGCFVPTDLKTADEAMAWKFYITEEEYTEDLLFEA